MTALNPKILSLLSIQESFLKVLEFPIRKPDILRNVKLPALKGGACGKQTGKINRLREGYPVLTLNEFRRLVQRLCKREMNGWKQTNHGLNYEYTRCLEFS